MSDPNKPANWRPKTRGKAIRLFCVECTGGREDDATFNHRSVSRLIRDCAVTNCPLWTFRPGAKRAP